MSREERVCRSLPSWMLRLIVKCGLGDWPGSAWLTLHKREVVDFAIAYADDHDAYPVSLPPGMH